MLRKIMAALLFCFVIGVFLCGLSVKNINTVTGIIITDSGI